MMDYLLRQLAAQPYSGDPHTKMWLSPRSQYSTVTSDHRSELNQVRVEFAAVDPHQAVKAPRDPGLTDAVKLARQRWLRKCVDSLRTVDWTEPTKRLRSRTNEMDVDCAALLRHELVRPFRFSNAGSPNLHRWYTFSQK